jgi:hypothetical protein
MLDGPFVAREALADGLLTFRELRRAHRGLYPGVWVRRGVECSTAQHARAAWLWSGRSAVIAGLSASALLGARWIDPQAPVELIHTNRRPPPGIVVRTDRLAAGEVRLVDSLPVTTAARTAFDLGRRLALRDGVQRVDALMNATGLTVPDVEEVLTRHPGVRGLHRLRETLALVDGGAESPYESLTRLALWDAGFPRPQTQVLVCDEYGLPIARIDLGWPEYRVGVDFDGAHHWTDARQRSKDIDRYHRISDCGWIDVRLTSGILHNRPQTFLTRVAAALHSRGCPIAV